MAASPPVTRLSLPSIPEFTAWMTIEEQEVPLYSVQEQPNKTICYVESKTGQHFAIHFADTRIVRKHGLAAQVMIHGECEVEQFSVRFQLRAAFGPDTTERPFIFDNVKTTGNEDLACSDEAVHKSLGNVNLVLKRWKSKTKRETERINGTSAGTPVNPAVYEDSKLASLSHAVSFGATQETHTAKSKHVYNFIDPETPFSDFEFRGRSRLILESQGLIPTLHQSSTAADQPLIQTPSSSCRSRSETLPKSCRSDSHSLRRAPTIVSQTADDLDDVILSQAELAKLQDELAELKRQSRIAAIERRLSAHSESQKGEVATKVKRDGADRTGEGSGMKKKVKLEKEGNGGSSVGMFKGKGEEEEVIVLSDSD
ncbi:hypothetical protein JCM5353_006111 [Sporobolomyces roseus]